MIPVCFGRGGESGWNRDSVLAKLTDHLSERRVFPSNYSNIIGTEFIKPFYVYVRGGTHCCDCVVVFCDDRDDSYK